MLDKNTTFIHYLNFNKWIEDDIYKFDNYVGEQYKIKKSKYNKKIIKNILL